MEAGQRFSATTPSTIALPENDNKCDESKNGLASNQGSTSTLSATEGNMHYQEDCGAMRRCSSSRGFEVVGAGAKVGESNIVTRSESPTTKRSKHEGLNMMSANVHAGKSKSKSNAVKIMESGVSAISTKLFEYKNLKADIMIQKAFVYKETFNQMLAEGSDAWNHNISHSCGALIPGNHFVSLPQHPFNVKSSSLPSAKSKSKTKVLEINEPGVSAIPTKMVEHDQSSQASLQTQEKELRTEVSRLKERLSSYSHDCFKLRKENKALLDKLRQECSKEEIVELEIINPDKDAPPSDSSSDESDEDVDSE